jgi:putative hydrolase of the HAD superfamily
MDNTLLPLAVRRWPDLAQSPTRWRQCLHVAGEKCAIIFNGVDELMSPKVRAVLFDMGGTLEDLYYTDATRQEATHGLHTLLVERGLDPHLPLPELQATVLSGMKAYAKWREKSEMDLSPERVWMEYIFPHQSLPKERLMEAAEDLTFFYETHFHVRSLRAEVPATLEALAGMGFCLGVISNIISRHMVQTKLAEYGIAHFFNPIMTSSNFGWRKPNERIFLEAARLMGMPPAVCAYVGDTISRDVVGARRSGYGLAIQIKSFLTDKSDQESDTEQPDVVIHDLTQVVNVVTER